LLALTIILGKQIRKIKKQFSTTAQTEKQRLDQNTISPDDGNHSINSWHIKNWMGSDQNYL
jgi:hypothetical protein